MRWVVSVVILSLASCTVGPTAPKGEITMQGRGAEALTNDGDPLMETGTAIRKVPIEFAKGYTKGVADQVKRTYWARQDSQRTANRDNGGRVKYYDATIPEREDSGGNIRVQREVVIPIVE